jgi:hypothetical protein
VSRKKGETVAGLINREVEPGPENNRTNRGSGVKTEEGKRQVRMP